MNLLDWAQRHHVSPEAVRELCESAIYLAEAGNHDSEARVQSEIRRDAARLGKYLFRNNRGAGQLKNGSFVRWGLANDSKQFGDEIKSADLIGWERIEITPQLVGTHVARFLSVEAKRRDWKFSGSLEDIAQAKWAAIVNAQGGRAIITNDSVLI